MIYIPLVPKVFETCIVHNCNTLKRSKKKYLQIKNDFDLNILQYSCWRSIYSAKHCTKEYSCYVKKQIMFSKNKK